IKIVGSERAANLSLGNVAIEGPVEPLIGDFDRIIRHSVELRVRGETAVDQHKSRRREQRSPRQRE
ncbi:MAG: hypothetical protein WBE48_01940, partial [Xanthobacteraceae bacterium]